MTNDADYKDVTIPGMMMEEELVAENKIESNTSQIKVYKTEDKTILEGKTDVFVFTAPSSAKTKLNLTRIPTAFRAMQEEELQENMFLKNQGNRAPQVTLTNSLNTSNIKVTKNTYRKNHPTNKINSIIMFTLILLIMASMLFILQEKNIIDMRSIATYFQNTTSKVEHKTNSRVYNMDSLIQDWTNLIHSTKKS